MLFSASATSGTAPNPTSIDATGATVSVPLEARALGAIATHLPAVVMVAGAPASAVTPGVIDVTLPANGVLLVWVTDAWCAEPSDPRAGNTRRSRARRARATPPEANLVVGGMAAPALNRWAGVQTLGGRLSLPPGASTRGVLTRGACSVEILVHAAAIDEVPPTWGGPASRSKSAWSGSDLFWMSFKPNPSEPGFLLVQDADWTALLPERVVHYVFDGVGPSTFIVHAVDLAGHLSAPLTADGRTGWVGDGGKPASWDAPLIGSPEVLAPVGVPPGAAGE